MEPIESTPSPTDQKSNTQIAVEVSSRATALVKLIAVAELQNKNIDELSQSVENLSKAVDNRSTKKQTIGLTGMVAIVILALVLSLFVPLLLVAKDNHKNTSIIRDCTTQTGKCYEAAQQDAKNRISVITDSDKLNRCKIENFYISYANLNGLKTPPLDSDCLSNS